MAWKIASEGFANLSTIDTAFYGNGIAFSSSASYTVPYFSNTRKPAILICFTIPGNPYPVIEHPKDELNLYGKALVPGYQSHYVVTTAAGFPLKLQDWNRQLKRYDELVIYQETQAVPIFLIQVDTSNMNAVLSLYNQSVLSTKDEPPALFENDQDEEESLLRKQSESDESSSSDVNNVKMDEVISLQNLLKRDPGEE